MSVSNYRNNLPSVVLQNPQELGHLLRISSETVQRDVTEGYVSQTLSSIHVKEHA